MATGCETWQELPRLRKERGEKNESNRNGGRMYLLLCCKKGLVGMITGES